MGCFSWLYADLENENVKIDGDTFTLLFPDGRKWTDSRYDGYGNIYNPDNGKRVDIYALLACWNRNLIVENLSPENAINPLFSTVSKEVVNKFFDLSFDIKKIISEVESGDYTYNETIRLAGITANFDNKISNDTDFLPIKLVYDKSLNYNDVEASLDDPNQGGWVYDYDEDDEDDYVGQCDYCGCDIYSDDDYIDDNGLFCSCECENSYKEDTEDEDNE